WGTAGLTASAGIAGWVEFLLLRRSLNRVVGKSGLEARFVVKLWIASLVSGAAGFALKTALPLHHPFLRGVAVLAIFGLIYFPLGALLGIDEAKQMVQRGLRVIRR
ncbi:MAG: murein biosynthesis integral membrane protein MurJ, partial [Bdellovibrionota bacterium]